MFRNQSLLALAVLTGCAASDTSGSGAATTKTPTKDASTSGGGSGGSSGGGPGDDAGEVTEDSGSVDFDSGSTASTIALPFYVSDQFVPTGFMGDSQASMTAITMAHDAATCKSPRNPGAGGDCFTATWAPTGSAPQWAGVYWQSPANNWGGKQGKPIAAGATKVSFYAAGAVGGETIQLSVGGINSAAPTPTLPYGDTFAVKPPAITLTTSWTQYEISLQGASYTNVLGGFCWVASATASESITFYIDDLKWE